MAFWKCYFHIVWATKHRQPIIEPSFEPVLFEAIQQKSSELKCPLLAVNAAFDHVHVAANITPSIAVATYVGALKGASSHALNTNFDNRERFRWQESYGVLTFGEKALPIVRDYIARQKDHHQSGTVNAYLETME